MDRVAIALGSNLGDRAAHLDFACSRLRPILHGLAVSRYYDTEPVDVDEPQPHYLNAAAIGETTLTPHALLTALLEIETDAGRTRPHHHAARTLDLDLILFGDRVIDEPALVVPHPGFRTRRFVLEPLAEIAPDLVDPVTGRSVRHLLGAL